MPTGVRSSLFPEDSSPDVPPGARGVWRAACEPDEAERQALLAFRMSARGGPQLLLRLAETCGSLTNALAGGHGAGLSDPLLRSAVAEATRHLPRAGRTLRDCARRGLGVMVAGEPAYPPLLAADPRAPLILFVQGAPFRPAPRVSVVGTREAAIDDLDLTRDLSAWLTGHGVEVVSGGAVGIDAAAHAGAVSCRRATTVVLGSGIDHAGPASNRPLFDRVLEAGGRLVSEFPPSLEGARHQFVQRNRIIAGLSSATVFVRGRVDSGAVYTCEHAYGLGRRVYAVPGRPGEPLARGPHQWIREGKAVLLDRWEQLLSDVDPEVGVPDEHRPVPLPPDLTGDPARVWSLLGVTPQPVDALATTASMTVPAVLAALLELELRGLCSPLPGMYFARRSVLAP